MTTAQNNTYTPKQPLQFTPGGASHVTTATRVLRTANKVIYQEGGLDALDLLHGHVDRHLTDMVQQQA